MRSRAISAPGVVGAGPGGRRGGGGHNDDRSVSLVSGRMIPVRAWRGGASLVGGLGVRDNDDPPFALAPFVRAAYKAGIRFCELSHTTRARRANGGPESFPGGRSGLG